MTTREFIAIEHQVLPTLPRFTIAGSLMFIAPVGHVLRGICFEPSGFDKKTFYVNVFVLPLCVPTPHLYFTFGNRLRRERGGTRWRADESNMTSELRSELKLQAVPFLSRVESLLDFVGAAKSFSGNPHTAKAIGFALAYAGEIRQAVGVLDQLLSRLDLAVVWQREISDQVNALRATLVTSPAEAQQKLEAWETETAHNLGLDDFLVRRN